MKTERFVVVGIGTPTTTALQAAVKGATTEADWAAIDRDASPRWRARIANVRAKGDAWCVTVPADGLTAEMLDADDAVCLYSVEHGSEA